NVLISSMPISNGQLSLSLTPTPSRIEVELERLVGVDAAATLHPRQRGRLAGVLVDTDRPTSFGSSPRQHASFAGSRALCASAFGPRSTGSPATRGRSGPRSS